MSAVIKYRKGQERNIVIEKGEYADSIFSEQYERALRLTHAFVNDNDTDSLKTISFCGERGEGKTSCMATVLKILEHSANPHSDAGRYLQSLGLEQLSSLKIDQLKIIDPSFFKEYRNVLEIVVSQIYASFKTKNNDDQSKHRALLSSFQQVKKSLCIIASEEAYSIDEIHDLSVLAAGIDLKNQMAQLVKHYLEYVGADILIIPIDDIDLNMRHAYKMCEQIRKYLSVPNCVVYLSAKIPQLQKVIADALSSDKKYKNTGFWSEKEFTDMSNQYLNKLLPISSRVNLPKAYTFEDTAIEIYNGNHLEYSNASMKQAVVELIFFRTRYLFYNPYDSTSPIIPNNLRDLFNLIGLLASMEIVEDSRNKKYKSILKDNKNMFKSYFFTEWMNKFESKTQTNLNKLIEFDFGTSFNREVVAVIKNELEGTLKKDYRIPTKEDFEDEKSSDSSKKNFNDTPQGHIVSTDNFAYNVSVGDVFYLFSLLENETLSEENFALVFFLKSLYSIKLYEAYDEVTEKSGNIYPLMNADVVGLSVIDRRFEYTNKLQQLIGGSYFSYMPSDLIPISKRYKDYAKTKSYQEYAYDIRIINGKRLNALLKEVLEEFPKILQKAGDGFDEDVNVDEFNTKLNILEFFIFTIRCAVQQKEQRSNSWPIDSLRTNVDPFYYRTFYPKTGYYIFDIMAPFANVINPEFAYKRFSSIDDNLFKCILNYKYSLLNKIIKSAAKYRDYIKYEDDSLRQNLHRLLSDAAIRNADVLMSVKDNITDRKKFFKDSAEDRMRNFYSSIQKSGLKTQPTKVGGEPFDIEFHFLEHFDDILSIAFSEDELKKRDDEQQKKNNSPAFNLFWEIFDKDSTPSKPKNSDIEPTFETIVETVGALRNRKKILRTLKKIPFFNKMSDDELNLILPQEPQTYHSSREAITALSIYYHNLTKGQNQREDLDSVESQSFNGGNSDSASISSLGATLIQQSMFSNNDLTDTNISIPYRPAEIDKTGDNADSAQTTFESPN